MNLLKSAKFENRIYWLLHAHHADERAIGSNVCPGRVGWKKGAANVSHC